MAAAAFPPAVDEDIEQFQGENALVPTFNHFVHDGIGPLLANIIHNNIGAEFTVHESIYATQTSSGSCYYDGLTIEAYFG